jgi:hypothetical protein
MTPAHRSGAVLNEAPDGFRLFEYCCFVKGFDVTGEESVASAATIEDSIEVVSSNFGHDPKHGHQSPEDRWLSAVRASSGSASIVSFLVILSVILALDCRPHAHDGVTACQHELPEGVDFIGQRISERDRLEP